MNQVITFLVLNFQLKGSEDMDDIVSNTLHYKVTSAVLH